MGDKHYNLNYLFSKVSAGLESDRLQTSLTIPGPLTIYGPDVPHDALISMSDTYSNIHDAVSLDSSCTVAINGFSLHNHTVNPVNR